MLLSMRKMLFLFGGLLLAAGTLQGQPDDRRTGDPAAEARYREARRAFERFEKAHGHFVQTANAKMHYLTWGSPAGIPFLWAHGSLTNAYEMQTVADSLAKAGLFVIAIDYYGHGQTPIPAHEVSLYHVADDMKALLDQLRIPKAVVGGFSRGGFIATAFYDAYPDRVLGLVLEDGGSVATNVHYHTLSPAALEARVMAFETRQSATRAAPVRNSNCWPGSGRSPADGGPSRRPVQAVQPGEPRAIPRQHPAPDEGAAFCRFHGADRTPHHLPQPGRPLLILDATGPGDPFPFTEANRALQRQHPRLITHRHRVYPDADHNIHHVNPRQFTRDVLSFIGQVKGHHRLP
jgi:pimeloyl-ACP methyl ester carboxylesterase